MRLLLIMLAACSPHGEAALDAPDAEVPRIDAPASVPHRAFPQVTFGGGRVLSSMRLVVITAAGDPLATELGQFCSAIVTSKYWSQVTAEYGLGAPRGCTHVVGAAITASTMNDTQMKQYIANSIGATQPDGGTMYVLYLPPSVSFAGGTTCAYSGYHEPYGTLGDGWGVVERCQFDFASMLESLTIVGSHEILEAATDPGDTGGWGQYPTSAQPWTQSAWLPYGAGYPVEVADYCISSRVIENGIAYQRILSNAAAAKGDDPCVPALSVPYYNLTVPQDWYAVAPGATVDIPLTGWSTGSAAMWEISAAAAESSMPPPVVASRVIESPPVTIGSTTYHAMTSGQTATMHVTMGSAAPSGSWRVFWLYSFRVDASGADGIDGDDHDHLWRVGVYVP